MFKKLIFLKTISHNNENKDPFIILYFIIVDDNRCMKKEIVFKFIVVKWLLYFCFVNLNILTI